MNQHTRLRLRSLIFKVLTICDFIKEPYIVHLAGVRGMYSENKKNSCDKYKPYYSVRIR